MKKGRIPASAFPAVLHSLEWSAKSIHHPACPIARGKDIETITRNPCTCHVKAAKDALAQIKDPYTGAQI